mgnify:CR=1 FL=1
MHRRPLVVALAAAILFPFQAAIGDHQTRNAEALVHEGAAVLMSEYTNLPSDLADAALALLGNYNRLRTMGRAARRLGRPDAARDLARILLDVAAGGA